MQKGHPINCSWCGVTIAYGERDESHGICAACTERLIGSPDPSAETHGALPYAARDGRPLLRGVAESTRVRELRERLLSSAAAGDAGPVTCDVTFTALQRPVNRKMRLSRARSEPASEPPHVEARDD